MTIQTEMDPRLKVLHQVCHLLLQIIAFDGVICFVSSENCTDHLPYSEMGWVGRYINTYIDIQFICVCIYTYIDKHDYLDQMC